MRCPSVVGACGCPLGMDMDELAIARAGLATKLPAMIGGTETPRRNVVKERKERKRRFVAALALAGLRQSDFADRLNIDPGHLSKVLNGERDSLRLVAK